jgi:hypothetical protein
MVWPLALLCEYSTLTVFWRWLRDINPGQHMNATVTVILTGLASRNTQQFTVEKTNDEEVNASVTDRMKASSALSAVIYLTGEYHRKSQNVGEQPHCDNNLISVLFCSATSGRWRR